MSAPPALITGGAGFVGANLARRLVRDGHRVTVVARGDRAWRLEELRDDIEVIVADVRDAEAVDAAMRETRAEWVFHLAAHGGSSWQQDVREIVDTNVVGTSNLLVASAAAGVAAFVHAGSSSEYGVKDHAPSEDEALEPNSHYAVTKAAATYLTSLAARRDALPAVSLRLYSAYGTLEEPRRLIPTLVTHALRGTLPTLVDPAIARDFIHVDDVCDAFVLAARTAGTLPGAILNVGTGRQVTIKEVVELVRRTFGVAAEPQWGSMQARIWDTQTWVADPARLQALGWSPRYDLEAGLVRFADWVRSRPELADRYGAAA